MKTWAEVQVDYSYLWEGRRRRPWWRCIRSRAQCWWIPGWSASPRSNAHSTRRNRWRWSRTSGTHATTSGSPGNIERNKGIKCLQTVGHDIWWQIPGLLSCYHTCQFIHYHFTDLQISLVFISNKHRTERKGIHAVWPKFIRLEVWCKHINKVWGKFNNSLHGNVWKPEAWWMDQQTRSLLCRPLTLWQGEQFFIIFCFTLTYFCTQMEIAEEDGCLWAGDDQNAEYQEEEAKHVVHLMGPAMRQWAEIQRKLLITGSISMP